MKNIKLTKEEKIEALMQNRIPELVKRVYGESKVTQIEVQQLFNITKKDIMEFVQRKGLSAVFLHRKPGQSDGIYLIWLLFLYLVTVESY